MKSNFSQNIRPFVEEELMRALEARGEGKDAIEFSHLENAHVLGQESTYWHVKVHWLMLCWAVRHSNPKEFIGQILRIIGAATKTAFGLVPKGNTGGTNVSPFKLMPIRPEHSAIIHRAKLSE